MEILRFDEPYQVGIAYRANEPIRYQALCFDGRFTLNTGVIFEFSIQLTEAGQLTSIAEMNHPDNGSLETSLTLGTMLYILETSLGMNLDPDDWFWTNYGLNFPDVYHDNTYRFFDYMVERLAKGE